MHVGRIPLLLLLVSLPLALACPKQQHEGDTPSPTPSPAPSSTGAVDFSRIFLAELADGRWTVSHAAQALPEPVREQLQEEELDGITRKLDPAQLGDSTPFTVGDELVLVTNRGRLDARVSGLGGFLGGGNDWLVGVLEVPSTGAAAPSGSALAVLGPRPHAGARIQPSVAVPLGPRVGSALEAVKPELPKLAAQFSEWQGSGEQLDASKLQLGPECAKAFAPALPPGLEQLLVVSCNNEQQTGWPVTVSAIVALGETPQVVYAWNLDAWSLELQAVVDLDGDGIDELWVSASGHEWWSSSLHRWDGERYVEEEISADAL